MTRNWINVHKTPIFILSALKQQKSIIGDFKQATQLLVRADETMRGFWEKNQMKLKHVQGPVLGEIWEHEKETT